jgi:hypothetical protein
MHEASKKVNPERLFESAEAVLRTLADMARRGEGPWPYLPDLVGTPSAPRSLTGFNHEEVQEGTMFLVRLGFISLSQTP